MVAAVGRVRPVVEQVPNVLAVRAHCVDGAGLARPRVPVARGHDPPTRRRPVGRADVATPRGDAAQVGSVRRHRVDRRLEVVAPPLAGAAAEAISEALANVARHSGATAANIDVTADPAGVVIEVSDDGRGGATLERGLRGLSDRAEALGGVLTVDSPTGGPTAIRLELPVRSPAGTYN